MFCYNYAYVCTCIEPHFVFRGLMGQAGRKCILVLYIYNYIYIYIYISDMAKHESKKQVYKSDIAPCGQI